MRKTILALTLATLATPTFADDGHGPDFFSVRDVRPNDVLNIRALPSASAQKVGEIPFNGTGIVYAFCIGETTFQEWSAMTEAERDAATRLLWCKVTYNGVTGWAAGRFLGE